MSPFTYLFISAIGILGWLVVIKQIFARARLAAEIELEIENNVKLCKNITQLEFDYKNLSAEVSTKNNTIRILKELISVKDNQIKELKTNLDFHMDNECALQDQVESLQENKG